VQRRAERALHNTPALDEVLFTWKVIVDERVESFALMLRHDWRRRRIACWHDHRSKP